MRKLFTFAVAILASVSLMAVEPTFESYDWGADDFATVFADHDGIVISSDASAWKGNFSGIQYVALGGGTDMSAASPTPYFGVTAAAGIDSVEIYWCPNGTDASNLAWIAWDDAANFKQQQVDYKGEGPEYTGSKSIEGATWQMFDFSATDEKAILFGRQLKKVMYEGSQYQLGKNKTVNILGVRVWVSGATPNTDPVLNVDKEEVTLAVTAAEPSAEAVVKFTGKNLAAGEYALNVPNVADLTVSPTSVTVGEDGKLNAQVTITYASTVDVAAASTAISLTIGELSKSVAINYSAALAKQYLANSLNIEQLVLDNGVGYDIAAAFAAANIDYNNIDALDSLNDEKANRNYAYLGLKLKKADAKLGCWLQAGHSIKIRFGNVGANFLVSANGSAQTMTNALANATVESANELPFTATEDTYLEIICNSTKTLVVKQIMLDEDIQAVTLPEPLPTGINNTEAAVKAVKVIRDGKLFIEKNGVLYNAQGAVIR